MKRSGPNTSRSGPTSPTRRGTTRPNARRSPRLKDGRSALALAGPRWEHLWPVDDYKETPRAIQSLAWTNWPLFTVGMVQRGHSDDTIRKILGENVLRVWRDNTPAKS